MKITHNGKEIELTEEQMKVLGLEEPKEYKRWKPEIGERYFGRNNDGDIVDYKWQEDPYDIYAYKIRGVCKTEAEAQKARDRQFALVRVNDRIMELNADWKPDWRNIDQRKYTVKYDHLSRKFTTDNFVIMEIPMNLDWIASNQVADQIIKECEGDLRLVFGIE